MPGESLVQDNPVLKSIEDLKKHFGDLEFEDERELKKLSPLLLNLTNLCDPNRNNTESDTDKSSVDTNANAAIAARNGGVELVTSICGKVASCGNEEVIVSALQALTSLLRGMLFFPSL